MDWKEFSLGLLVNWKTIVTIAGLIGTTSFTSCSWLNAREDVKNERQAVTHLSEAMLDVPRETSPTKTTVYRQYYCDNEKVLEKLDQCLAQMKIFKYEQDKLREHHE